MPARKDIKSICVLGSGPIVIGQAAEFDYSGTQAIKALKEDGYRVVLVNSNPATIMTDPEFADATYVEPLTVEVVTKILEKERPDALLPTVGGQTALNLAMDLDKTGILRDLNIELIGAEPEVIDRAENRQLFKAAMKEIGLESARSEICHTWEEALAAKEKLGLPAVIRPSFTLGGSGGGIAMNEEDFETIVKNGLEQSPTNEILLEESILGWKEYEFEVMRDKADNVVIICSIENLDPMGVHTGDSITVAPAQTLTDKEYQILRNASIDVMRVIGVKTGGSNVQFAVNPDDGRVVVIEMNPRVSRSSALASKATGYPIAKMAAKVAVGYNLDEIMNDITLKTKAAFEPALDYVVVKIPRFAFEKFPGTPRVLTTQMRSVGEAMAIGRTFQESMSKALRSLEHGVGGIESAGITKAGGAACDPADLLERLGTPAPERLWLIIEALRQGHSIEAVHHASGRVDPWFLAQIQEMVAKENEQAALSNLESLDATAMRDIKKLGFSDAEIGQWFDQDETSVRAHRKALGVRPVYKRIDTCAAEFEAHTPYMYSCYETPFSKITDNGVVEENACESEPTDRQKIMILGGGPIRIGQGIEFDYCCVQASYALRDAGYETIMVNCNPETVSTDYDTSDRLFFEPVTLEDVLEIVDLEKPKGVIVQFGGQTPLKLARALEAAGVPIIGTTPDQIDRAEDRERFQQMIQALGLLQPANTTVRSVDEAVAAAREIGYPLVVRPSYVLGGRAMEIVYREDDLLRYMRDAVQVSDDSPVLLDRFLSAAIEVDIDAVSDGDDVVIGSIMQHIEQAGIHSGDSACSLPPYSLPADVQDKMRDMVKAMAVALEVKGLMNVQLAWQDDEIYVIEVNPRASRTVPFVSKAIGVSLAKIAARCMAGQSLESQGFTGEVVPSYYSVKEAVLPFNKFPGIDPILGPEMKSTGEVMGTGPTFADAFAKAQLGAGDVTPQSGLALFSVRDADKAAAVEVAKRLVSTGFTLAATKGTAKALQQAGLDVRSVNKVAEGRPHIVDLIKNDEASLIINTTEGRTAILDSASIRSSAEQHQVFYTTTLAAAEAICMSMEQEPDGQVRRLQDLHVSLANE